MVAEDNRRPGAEMRRGKRVAGDQLPVSALEMRPDAPRDARTAEILDRFEIDVEDRTGPMMEWKRRADPPESGPRRLMIAMLEQAIDDIRKGVRLPIGEAAAAAAEPQAHEAWRWLRSDARGHLFSFRAICDVLELDAQAIVAALESRDWGRVARMTLREPERPDETKWCPRCKRTKQRREFYADPRTADGVTTRCAECRKLVVRECYHKRRAREAGND